MKDVVISGEGFKLIPIVGYGLPSWLRGLGDRRELPIALAARAMSGTVTVQPPSGYRASGLPSNEKVVAGPMSFEAMWTVQGGEPTLTWSLRFDEDSVGPELGPQVSALGAAVERTRQAQLVLEEI